MPALFYFVNVLLTCRRPLCFPAYSRKDDKIKIHTSIRWIPYVISETKIEVRYAETDQMGVVYHANYLVWMEIGRTKLIEDLGFKYAEMEKDGILAPVIDVNISYKQPMKYGETAKIKTWIDEYDGLRVTYGYEILTEQDVIRS